MVALLDMMLHLDRHAWRAPTPGALRATESYP